MEQERSGRSGFLQAPARQAGFARRRAAIGLLHGGVSVVLAETLGSCGAAYASPEGHRAAGLDINANHIKGTISGWVTGITLETAVDRSLPLARPHGHSLLYSRTSSPFG